MDIDIRAFLIAIPLGLSFVALLLAYEDSCNKRRFSWKGLGIALAFFAISMIQVLCMRE